MKEFKISIIIFVILVIIFNIIILGNKNKTSEEFLYRIEITSAGKLNNNTLIYTEIDCDRNFIAKSGDIQILYNRQDQEHINVYKLTYKNLIQRLFFDAGYKYEVYQQYSVIKEGKNE